jgi:N-acetyltransferase 10
VLNATRRGQSNPVVSVKSGKAKRKEGPTASEIYEEAFGDKRSKKAKKSRKSH